MIVSGSISKAKPANQVQFDPTVAPRKAGGEKGGNGVVIVSYYGRGGTV